MEKVGRKEKSNKRKEEKQMERKKEWTVKRCEKREKLNF
jgi:hypothetical protein